MKKEKRIMFTVLGEKYVPVIKAAQTGEGLVYLAECMKRRHSGRLHGRGDA